MPNISEIEKNFTSFSARWRKELQDTQAQLEQHASKFLESYSRMASINAWRESFLEQKLTSDSLAFFVEAQNDILVSHVFARIGAWRSALKSLRSCLENVLYCCFYKDHPVELRMWEEGEHRLSFRELHEYFAQHPDIKMVPEKLRGLNELKSEFSTLSKAVHGSAESFRMTKEGVLGTLWTTEQSSFGPWLARERATLNAINLFLVALFHKHLQGASQPSLRTTLATAIQGSLHAELSSQLKIKIPKP